MFCIPAAGAAAAAAAAEAADGNDKNKGGKAKDKEDKVKIAKKIAKDMERWAKTLNQKKENAKQGLVTSAQSLADERQSAAADAGFAILEKHQTTVDRIAFGGNLLQPSVPESPLAAVAGARETMLVPEYGGGSDSDSEAEGDEGRLLDWAKLACLLCKRQFPSKEVLTKHVQLSGLHKVTGSCKRFLLLNICWRGQKGAAHVVLGVVQVRMFPGIGRP